MKAIEYTSYGAPEVLKMKEVPRPEPKPNEILIRIKASSVTATESKFRQGRPYVTRLFNGLTAPRIKRLGEELAGTVMAVGDQVSQFKVGDDIFGTAGPNFSANAEYICLPENGVITKMPTNISYEEAATSIDGFLTALTFLRDEGNISSGQKVLIIGASGSIGSSAVQIANYYGARVTGVCSTINQSMVETIGAHQVIAYDQADFKESDGEYDIILDAVGKTSFSECKHLLKKNGRFLEVAMNGDILMQALITSIAGTRKAKFAAAGLRDPQERLKDLHLLEELMEVGIILPVLDRTYVMEEIVEAHRYVDQGHKRGNVAISIGG
ncbi:MAG: NAD(P)-dependent alcohol dehydrogenase [Cyclobacteriaceae bacterium]